MKILFCLAAFLLTGCYTCKEALLVNYDNCMKMRYDSEFCMTAAKMQAQKDGYCNCSSTNINYGINYNW